MDYTVSKPGNNNADRQKIDNNTAHTANSQPTVEKENPKTKMAVCGGLWSVCYIVLAVIGTYIVVKSSIVYGDYSKHLLREIMLYILIIICLFY